MKSKTMMCATVSVICLVLFIALIMLLKLVDVQPIGPEQSVIGLAGLNSAVRDSIAFNDLFDKVSDVIFLLAFVVAFEFVIIGIIQLLKRKSIFKIDRDLYLIAGAFVAMVAIYAFFELVIINYRPIIEVGGELEASFPSSHVLVIFTVVGIAVHQTLVRARGVIKIVGVSCLGGLLLLGLVCRVLSGVHWITDILGALLISGAIVFCYLSFYYRFINNKTAAQKECAG